MTEEHDVEVKDHAADHHHEVTPNPDYAGPGQHCLPPEIHEGIGKSLYFVLLMVALLLGAAWLGVHLL